MSTTTTTTTRTPLPLLLALLGLLLALALLPLPATAFVLPIRSRVETRAGRCPLSSSIVGASPTTTSLSLLATTTGNDASEEEGERVLSLHTLEVPLQDDPGNYRTYLEEHFKGSSLLRWHLGSVDTEKGVAHAEVVIVSPPGVTPPSVSS